MYISLYRYTVDIFHLYVLVRSQFGWTSWVLKEVPATLFFFSSGGFWYKSDDRRLQVNVISQSFTVLRPCEPICQGNEATDDTTDDSWCDDTTLCVQLCIYVLMSKELVRYLFWNKTKCYNTQGTFQHLMIHILSDSFIHIKLSVPDQLPVLTRRAVRPITTTAVMLQ